MKMTNCSFEMKTVSTMNTCKSANIKPSIDTSISVRTQWTYRGNETKNPEIIIIHGMQHPTNMQQTGVVFMWCADDVTLCMIDASIYWAHISAQFWTPQSLYLSQNGHLGVEKQLPTCEPKKCRTNPDTSPIDRF